MGAGLGGLLPAFCSADLELLHLREPRRLLSRQSLLPRVSSCGPDFHQADPEAKRAALVRRNSGSSGDVVGICRRARGGAATRQHAGHWPSACPPVTRGIVASWHFYGGSGPRLSACAGDWFTRTADAVLCPQLLGSLVGGDAVPAPAGAGVWQRRPVP